MAGKNRSQRIKIIDKYLRTKRKYTWENLRDYILQDNYFVDKSIDDISKRTIRDDIAEMRKGFMGLQPAPIPKSEEYYYYDKDFNLFASPIQDQETYVLMNAMDILSQFPDFDHSKKVKEVIDKLRSALDISDLDQNSNVLDFEKVEYPSAGKWIGKLYPYLKNREALKLCYQPFNVDAPLIIPIVPLMLKEFNGRWYLISYQLETKHIYNYALDRIVSYEEYYFDLTNTKIDFDPEAYFDDLVGVSYQENGPEEVTFQCSDYLSNYFRTKPIHHSQDVVDDPDHIFKIYCHINIELVAKFLSYGEDIKVLAPKSIVATLKSKTAAMKANYG